MIRYIGPSEVDRPQWDALLAQAPNGLIYGLSWYLDIVSPGWAALVKEEAGRYVAVLPLPVCTKFGLRYLKQPPFAQQLGLFYLAEPTAADWQQIGELIRRHFRFVTTYSFNTTNDKALVNAQLAMDGAVASTYYLRLQPAYPQLVAAYSPNRRRQLRQAQLNALRVEPTTDIDLMISIFAENTAGKIYGIRGEAYEYPMLRKLYRAASQVGMSSMWQVCNPDGEILAMMLLWRFKNQFTYIFNSSTAAGKEARAISVLLDELFRAHARQDLSFDFEAPSVAGLTQFYSSFGSVAMPFLTVSYNRLPWPVRQLRAARMALYRKLQPRSADTGD